MIQLRKSIKVGPTVVPAGTVLHNQFQSNVVYYRGTRIEIDKIPQDAIYVPGEYAMQHMLIDATESKHIGDYVQVRTYAASRPGDAQVIAKGKLTSLGEFAKLRRQIAADDAVAYEHIAKHCKTGQETVWKVDNQWFCFDGKTALEDAALTIVPAKDVANTDYVMLNGVVVARIVSPSLAKAPYPDNGYLNSKAHQLTVLNNEGQPIELKCIKNFAEDEDEDEIDDDSTANDETGAYDDSDAMGASSQSDEIGDASSSTEDSEIILEQDILNELAPILQGNESLCSDLTVDCTYLSEGDVTDASFTPTELATLKGLTDTLKQSFDQVCVFASGRTVYICCYDRLHKEAVVICSVEAGSTFYFINPNILPKDIEQERPKSLHAEPAVIVRKIFDIVAPNYILGANSH